MATAQVKQSSANHAVRGAWRASHGGLLAILFFSGFINLLKFAMPLYLLQVLDRVPESRSVETLVMLTIAASIAVLTAVAVDHIRQRLLSRWGIWIEAQFGTRLFQRAAAAGEVGETATLRQPLDNLTKTPEFRYTIRRLMARRRLGANLSRRRLSGASVARAARLRRRSPPCLCWEFSRKH